MADIGLSGTLKIRMALTYSALAILVLSSNTLVTQIKANMGNATTVIVKSMLDPKRRNELIDEAFLEQKDMLLDMLETKLKEVRDKKKNKLDPGENVKESNNNETNCEFMPKEVDVVLKAHGISAIGDTDVQLKYGENGNGSLRLDATGISNVGKVHVELGVGGGNVHIPGLNNLFTGETLLKKVCHENKIIELDNRTLNKLNSDQLNLEDQQTRRVNRDEEKTDSVLTVSATSNYVEKSVNSDFNNNDAFNYNHENTSSTLNDNMTVVAEENKEIIETVNDTNTLTPTDV